MEETISEMNLNFDSIIDEEQDNDGLVSCSRCGGLLVSDRCYDLSSSGIFKIAIQRCIQCGDVIDPIILKHRMSNPELGRTRRSARRYPLQQILS